MAIEKGKPILASDVRPFVERAVLREPARNLFNPDTITQDYYVIESTGVLNYYEGYVTSDFIPVKGGEPYTVRPARKLVFYNENYEYVTGYNLSQSANFHTYTAPVDGYARFSFSPNIGGYRADIQFEAGTVATEYDDGSTFSLPNLVLLDEQKGSGGNAGIRVIVNGAMYTIESTFPNGDVLQRDIEPTATGNRTVQIRHTRLNGVTVHTSSDDSTPIRTFNTVGANHGYTCISSYLVTGHGKTEADLGSVYSDGTREYTLLVVDGDELIFGHPYSVDGITNIVTGLSAEPAATLNHVSGGTNTNPVPITTAGPTTQLLPSVNKAKVRAYLDGKLLSGDGEYNGTELVIHEEYTIMDYKSLIDWSRSHIGQSYDNDDIEGVVKQTNSYHYRGGGECLVSCGLLALKPVSLSTTGFLQAIYPVASGYNLFRYMPGVVAKSGYDFSTLVDMSGYSTSITFSPADSLNTGKPPSRYVDWLQDSNGNKLIGFTMGYITDKTHSKDSERETLDAVWDMRSTKKVYPVALKGVLEAGDYRQIEGFRNYILPHESGATIVNTVEDSEAVYVHIDFHMSVTGMVIPLPEYVGKSITVLDSYGLTVANTVVDSSGIVVNVPGTFGYAVLKLV